MKTLNHSSLILIGALALAGTAYAQVPSSNDTSDGSGNTGMGSFALGGPTAKNLTGSFNTASGFSALASNTTGNANTATGNNALITNTSGSNNTGSGFRALASNTTGNDNTASGMSALFQNMGGADNTASGYEALFLNSSGNDNTASGVSALANNTTGNANTASGFGALFANSTGTENIAFGVNALHDNTTANANTASGFDALFSNTTGCCNIASGASALQANTSGGNNTASGFQALLSNTTGDNNIAEGYQAGSNLTTGSNNIDIGNVGVAGENNIIRIGTKGTHKAAVIAGIDSTKVTGSAVYVTTTGRLGVLASSERFKTAVAPIGDSTEKMEQLRPVSFHLKAEPKGAVQYGLIAEEVAKVYPELVTRDDSGKIDGVRYDELAPMLLNEVQQQAATIRDLKQVQFRTQQQMAELKALNQATQVALQKLLAKDELIAQR
jgi:hypothetical protein